MNINKIDNNSFKGKLILREQMFPNKNSKVVPSELKELVETFEKRTANQSGTMFVQKITKDLYGLTMPRQMNTYFKNGNYTDAMAVADEKLFEAFNFSEPKFSIKETAEKLINIFNRYKEREQVVEEEIKPLQEKINLLQKELKNKKHQIETKDFEYEIVSSAQPDINGQSLLNNGLCYDYFKDIDDCLKLQNKTIAEAE